MNKEQFIEKYSEYIPEEEMFALFNKDLNALLESSQLSEDIAEKNCKNCKYFQNNCHPDVPCSACTRKEHYIFKNDYWITNTKKVELIKKQELLKHCGTCKYLDNGIDMCIDCKADFTNWQPKSNSIA